MFSNKNSSLIDSWTWLPNLRLKRDKFSYQDLLSQAIIGHSTAMTFYQGLEKILCKYPHITIKKGILII